MQAFADYFSEEAIVEELCKLRVRQADKRHEALFFRQISSGADAHEPGNELDIFPPRKQWNKYRNRHRHGQPGSKVNLVALKRAMMKLRCQQPLQAWAVRLNERISSIRHRALYAEGFQFAKPRIFPIEKDKDKAQFRPIATFDNADDKVIEGLTARYFRENLDHLFTDSSFAFRCGQNGRPPPTQHDALKKILTYRKYYEKTGLYVAECDITGFFDCVDHEVALDKLLDLCRAAIRKDPSCIIEERAVQIFKAYLDCYTFQQNVKAEAEPDLKRKERNNNAHFKWPEKELSAYHKNLRSAKIGVPQGGSLSCFIANCVLHHADQEVRRCKSEVSQAFRYLRYCDDMVLLAADRSTCENVFKAYQNALKNLLLPAHPSKRMDAYGRDFWQEKSKEPFYWGRNEFPWVQFVGYQVRYDGLLRITNKAFKKHRKKLTTAADDLLKVLNPGRTAPEQVPPFSPGIRKNPRKIIHRFRARLNAVSVGRRRLGDDLGKLSPMCWVSGFRALKGRRISLGMLRALDRHRERQIHRIIKRVKNLGRIEPNRRRVDGIRVPRYYGYPFSYVAQFSTPHARKNSRSAELKGRIVAGKV